MQEKKLNATLNDVAKKAGVSITTASRVLSNANYPVSQKLKQKVHKAAAELKYVPNVYGQMLKTNISNVIGVIVPSLQNPFYNQAIFGIESAASKEGYEIRLLSSHRTVEQERNNIMALLHSRIMALIIFSIDINADTLNNYIACGGKVALLESDYELEHAITAVTDCYAAGKTAARHLIEYGHRNIAFLTSPLTKLFRRRVLSGVKDELTKAGIGFTEKDVYVADVESESTTGQYEFEIGKQLAKWVIYNPKRYTAIIAINDITAYGVIQALSQHGLHVPEDVSVLGFDNIMYSEMISPPLTTIELPSNSMGFTACQMLIAKMSADETEMQSMQFKYPCVLKERKSTLPLK